VSGPQYPPGPLPGSNAIGTFGTGSSPIGDIPRFNLLRTVIRQYGNSDIILKIIRSFYEAADQTQNFQSFFDLMWNLQTAEGYGLDCWGTIVAVNRVLKINTGPKYLGFDEGGTLDYDPFNQSPWYSGQKITDNYLLSDDGFRVLIIAKAFSNICDGSIASINFLLRLLFGSQGRCYCTDGLNMTMTYTFEFPLLPLQIAILTQSGVFPTPVGVSYSIVQL
jgi:hypothetical protein